MNTFTIIHQKEICHVDNLANKFKPNCTVLRAVLKAVVREHWT